MGTDGGKFDVSDRLTADRLNRKTTLVDTGAGIAASTATPGMIAFCTASGSGFVAGDLYERDESNTFWRRIFEAAVFDVFGDGSDGILNVTSGTTTLSADKQYKAVHVESGATLDTAGYTLRTLYLRNEGTITDSVTGGAGGAGGSGGTSPTIGGDGTAPASSGSGYGGGGGRDGGDGGAGNGGIGGNGGGHVRIFAMRLNNTGTVHANAGNGANGINATVGGDGAGAGGGGGGGNDSSLQTIVDGGTGGNGLAGTVTISYA